MLEAEQLSPKDVVVLANAFFDLSQHIAL